MFYRSSKIAYDLKVSMFTCDSTHIQAITIYMKTMECRCIQMLPHLWLVLRYLFFFSFFHSPFLRYNCTEFLHIFIIYYLFSSLPSSHSVCSKKGYCCWFILHIVIILKWNEIEWNDEQEAQPNSINNNMQTVLF